MKKFLSVFLTAALAVSMLAGCGSKNETVTAKVIDIDLTNEEYAFGVDKNQSSQRERTPFTSFGAVFSTAAARRCSIFSLVIWRCLLPDKLAFFSMLCDISTGRSEAATPAAPRSPGASYP